MRIAYLTNQYPKVSHTFIRREILALETLGVPVERFSIRGAPEAITDPEDTREAALTRLLLDGDHLGMAGAVSRIAASRPLAFTRAVKLVAKISSPSDRPTFTEYMYLAEACRLVEWCNKAGVDHIHAHFGTNPAAVTMLAQELGGPGYSFTVHGPEEFDRASVLHLGEKISRARFVVAISHFGKSQLSRQCGYEHWDKIHVVRCGVDDKFLNHPALPIPDHPTLVCVGRLSEQKGQMLLLEAAQLCRTQVPDFKLILVGDGELRPQIEQKIAELNLQAHVKITGWASGEVVKQHLIDSRALVLPSFAEGLPVVIMEALALGRPVLTTYVAGIPELVETGANGWLFPAGSVPALTQAMVQALTASQADLTRMGLDGRSRVLDQHDVRKNAEQLRQLFERYLP